MKKYKKLFIQLCERYYASLYKYICFYTGDRDAASDIVQETFLHIYKNMEKISQHTDPAGYIFKTAQNIAKAHKRNIYKRILREISIDEGEYTDINNNIEYIMDKNINEYDYIDMALDCLDDEKRKLYTMYYVNNMSMKEIASKLGIDYTALRMKYVRLRRQIKDRVKEIAKENFVT